MTGRSGPAPPFAAAVSAVVLGQGDKRLARRDAERLEAIGGGEVGRVAGRHGCSAESDGAYS